jgi:hypothetical protein
MHVKIYFQNYSKLSPLISYLTEGKRTRLDSFIYFFSDKGTEPDRIKLKNTKTEKNRTDLDQTVHNSNTYILFIFIAVKKTSIKTL